MSKEGTPCATSSCCLFVIGFAMPATALIFEKGEEAYERGDYEAALREWRLLAKRGNATAQYNLGLMYTKGQSVQRDYAEAVRWYRKAAEQGHSKAQQYLGFMYGKGLGVAQDYVHAHMWWNLAAKQGHKDAIKNRGVVTELMTSAEVAEAHRLAREWLAKFQQARKK